MANAAALGTTIRQSRSHRRGSVLAIGIAAAVALVLMVGAGYAIAMSNRQQPVADRKSSGNPGSNQFDQSPQGGATTGVPSITPRPSQSTPGVQATTPGAQTPTHPGQQPVPPGQPAPPQPKPIKLNPADYQNMSCPDARSAIEAKGLNTTRVDKDNPNAKANWFLDVGPTEAYKGQTVTVTCTPVASTPPSSPPPSSPPAG
jgi:hypothetical protein